MKELECESISRGSLVLDKELDTVFNVEGFIDLGLIQVAMLVFSKPVAKSALKTDRYELLDSHK